MRRSLLKYLINSTATILILIVASYVWLNTQFGLQNTFWLIKNFIPGKLQVQQLEGRLAGPITFTQLNYNSPDFELSIQKLQIDWSLKQLARKQLAIKNLFIEQANLIVKPSNTETTFVWHDLSYYCDHIKLSSAQINYFFIKFGNNKLQLNGRLNHKWQITWQLSISNLKDLSNNLQGYLNLQGNVSGERGTPTLLAKLDQNKIVFDDWRINNPQGLLTINTYPHITWRLILNIPLIQKNKKNFLSPLDLQAHGGLQPLNAHMRLAPTTFQYTTKDNNVIKLNLPMSQWLTIATPQGLHSDFKFLQNRVFNLTAALNFPNYSAQSLPTAKQPLQANINFQLHQLGYLNLMLPKLKNLRGNLRADLNITGTIINPKVNGTVVAQNASSEIPDLGLLLRNIQLKAAIDPNTVKWSGNLKSGSGQLFIIGSTSLKSKNLSTTLALQGKNFIASNTNLYKVTASTNLQIKADTTRTDVTGDVLIPYARIKLIETEETALSNDIVFTNQKIKKTETPLIYSKINLRIGDDVKFRYENLHATLKGNLLVTDNPNHPTIADGKIKIISGHYKYLNEKLAVKNDSYILFTRSPIDNPVLNITLTKTVTAIPETSNLPTNISTTGSSNFFTALIQPLQPATITVGIRVLGYAQNPQFKLFSEPIILSQTDILSYLITGQPANQLEAGSSQLLFNTASNLGSKNNDLKQLVKSVRQGIGLDQLSVQSTAFLDPSSQAVTQAPALVLGKALSPRLYINYSIGLLQPVNIFKINYLINKYFSLQSSNSTLSNSIDLLFKIEKE